LRQSSVEPSLQLEIGPTTLHSGKHNTTDIQREKKKKEKKKRRLMDLCKWSRLSFFASTAMALMLFWLITLTIGLKE